MNDTLTKVCPIDGGPVTAHFDSISYYVCASCHELLASDELVRHATRGTRARYLATDRNDHDAEYVHATRPPAALAPLIASFAVIVALSLALVSVTAMTSIRMDTPVPNTCTEGTR